MIYIENRRPLCLSSSAKQIVGEVAAGRVALGQSLQRTMFINLSSFIKVGGFVFNILKRYVKTNNVSFIRLFVPRACMAFMCPDIGELFTY